MFLEEIQHKYVLILGFGREGHSTYRFLRQHFPHLPLAVADKNTFQDIPYDRNLSVYLGANYLQYIHNFDIVIKSPGITPHLPEIAKAIKKGKRFTSQTQIFFELCPGKIIGVTGTKGKSTTTTLIHHVLRESGISTVLLGNIGNPPLDYIGIGNQETYFAFELSSHQLLDVTRSPHIAVIQNIIPEHLDYYANFKEYVFAKQNIARFQTSEDFFIFNADYPLPKETAKLTLAHKIPFSKKDFDRKIKSHLIGDFNKYNILPAIIIGDLLDIPKVSINKAIESFSPLDHRLQLIGQYRGISFYDAVLSTIPEATEEAIEALGAKVHTLICGGYERQQNYNKLARRIIESHIKNVILFPATGQRIWSEINKNEKTSNLIRHFFVDNMSDAVRLAYEYTPSGKICLLAPAAPSFTVFKDYIDEAQQFKNCIVKLSGL